MRFLRRQTFGTKILMQNTSDLALASGAANELLAGQFKSGRKHYSAPASNGAVGFEARRGAGA